MEKKVRKFKTPNSYVIIFFILVIVALLTWVIPGGSYDLDKSGQAIAGTYSRMSSNRQGIWDIIMAPIIGMVGNKKVSGAISISLNVLFFGSFLGMMDTTGAVNKALRGVAKKFQNKQNVLITVLTFIMGAFGTIQGAYEEGYVYLLMFLPIFLSLGLDTVTTMMIVVFGTQAGCAASIINPFSTGIASGIAGISPGEGIIPRTISFVLLVGLASFFICQYAKFIQKNPKKSVQYYRQKKDVEEFVGEEGGVEALDKKQKKVLGLFILTFAIMIISLVPWTSLNSNWTIFKDLANWINKSTILGTVFGSDIVPLGDWYFDEINGLLIVMTVAVGVVMGYSMDKTINIFIKGAGDLVSTAFIVPLARGIQVLMTNGNVTATILHFCEKSLGTLPSFIFIIVAFLLYIVLATFIPSSTGLAAATISVMAPVGIFAGVPQATMIMIYNFALGLVKMIAPTSIIVMTCGQYVHIDYLSWIKAVWKPLLGMFVLCLVILLIVTLI